MELYLITINSSNNEHRNHLECLFSALDLNGDNTIELYEFMLCIYYIEDIK